MINSVKGKLCLLMLHENTTNHFAKHRQIQTIRCQMSIHMYQKSYIQCLYRYMFEKGLYKARHMLLKGHTFQRQWY